MNDLTAWAIFGYGVMTGVALMFVLSALSAMFLFGVTLFSDFNVPDKIEGAQ